MPVPMLCILCFEPEAESTWACRGGQTQSVTRWLPLLVTSATFLGHLCALAVALLMLCTQMCSYALSSSEHVASTDARGRSSEKEEDRWIKHLQKTHIAYRPQVD